MIIEIKTMLLAAVATSPLIYTFFRHLIRMKKMKEIGVIVHILRPKSLLTKRFSFFLALITALFFCLMFSLAYLHDNLEAARHIVSLTITMISLAYMSYDYAKIFVGEKGLYGLGKEIIIWNSVDRTEFDKDIGQKQYGFKVYYKNKKLPEKWYLKREQIEELKKILENLKKSCFVC